jgi:hypothetical protein
MNQILAKINAKKMLTNYVETCRRNVQDCVILSHVKRMQPDQIHWRALAGEGRGAGGHHPRHLLHFDPLQNGINPTMTKLKTRESDCSATKNKCVAVLSSDYLPTQISFRRIKNGNRNKDQYLNRFWNRAVPVLN